MTEILEDKLYIQYAQDILSCKIKSCKYIKLACERFISWFDLDDRYFDYADVDRKIRFMSKIKHAKGPLAGKHFDLYPYQAWITANIVGWKWKEDNRRVINTALLMLARKSGKTFFASALMLALIMTDGEMGGEGYMIANSAQQASIAFEHASNHCKSMDPNNILFQRYRGEIRIPLLDAKMKILSAETSRLDGLSPSVFIVDEMHEANSMENFDILRTGQGARTNPCGIVISSFGFHVGEEYPLYGMWLNAIEVLQTNRKQDSLFAAIYQLDDEDDWKDENVWIKSNPTLGASIDVKFLREQVQQAINNPGQEVSIKTKNFNIWCTSEVTWIPREAIMEHTQSFNLEDFKQDDLYCYVGIDLSSVSDFTAITYMFTLENKYYFKTDLYLPDGSIDKSSNKDLYRKWIRDGYLKITHGARINYQEIVSDIMKNNAIIPILEIAYDPYNSAEAVRLLNDSGMVMSPFKQTKGNFNLATKEFERRFFNNEIILDDNPAVRWCFANAMLEYDNLENCKPVKGAGKNNKIDAVISILESFGTYILREEQIGTISHI